jgi:hypothetical protein
MKKPAKSKSPDFLLDEIARLKSFLLLVPRPKTRRRGLNSYLTKLEKKHVDIAAGRRVSKMVQTND